VACDDALEKPDLFSLLFQSLRHVRITCVGVHGLGMEIAGSCGAGSFHRVRKAMELDEARQLPSK